MNVFFFSNVHDFFPSQNSKLVYSFESLSLKPMQGNGVVYLTVLAPFHDDRSTRDPSGLCIGDRTST
jgi:hypothetical protein